MSSEVGVTFGLVLALALAGCSTMPDRQATAGPLPTSWDMGQAPTGSVPSSVQSWWNGFDDPLLSQLIEEATTSAPSVRLAQSRLMEARSTARQTVAAYLPQVSGRASGDYTGVEDGPDLVGSFQEFFTGGGAPAREREQMRGVYGPRVSWEVPLFGRVEAAWRGSRAVQATAQADLRGARAAIAADLADAYVDLRRAQNLELALSESAIAARRLADILDVGAGAGLIAPADAADARRLSASVRVRLPDVSLAVRQSQASIALLRGHAPGADDPAVTARLNERQTIPAPAAFAAPAAPAELLRMRPDIAASAARAEAAAANVAVARSDLLPQLNLTGGFSIADNLIGTGVAERSSQIDAQPVLSVPIFAWGQRMAAVRAANARFDQALIGYEQTVNQAVGEASTSLAALSLAKERLDAALEAELAAEATWRGVRAAYDAGIQSLADRLRAEQQLIDARVSRIEAQASQAKAAIAVYRAFGGGPPDLVSR
ncbi:MAG: efflux transporter outer membrane subunit [Caulobacterales bacterium]|jgi:NodT family efflux transporter outer membrane factor (OMF) lipoprotein